MGKRRPTSWLLGFAGSAVVHVCILAALFAFGRGVGYRSPAAGGAPETITLDPAATPFAAADPLAAAIPIDVDPPLPAWDAHQSDRDNLVPSTTAPSDSDGRRLQAPAPDSGAAGGRRPEHAFRRDESTLRSRLTDGSAESQPSRTRTSGRPASPQAIRREPVVGIGDSVHSKTPRRAPSPAAPSALALGGPTGGQTGNPTESPAASEAPLPPPSADLAAENLPDRGRGPLDAEPGVRSFDTERPGKAADDDTLRAASNEIHPGLTDFTRPSAPAKTAATGGHGPGARAGAVARPARGEAPSELGAPDRDANAAEVQQRARARQYDRYYAELKQRVNRALEFPKALALRLEQGEAIVYFVVGTDGRLADGPRVVKSAGFDEFDRAAVDAVRRAAPFPPTPTVRPINLPVTFDNPVIR